MSRLLRPAVVALAACFAASVSLTGCASGCAQEPLPVDPPPESTYISIFRVDDLVPGLSIQVGGDSARHFARTFSVARRLAGKPSGGGQLTIDLLNALRAMGAPRPFLRALVVDAERHPNLAAAAIRVLGDDPRPDECAEIDAFVRSLNMPPASIGGPGGVPAATPRGGSGDLAFAPHN